RLIWVSLRSRSALTGSTTMPSSDRSAMLSRLARNSRNRLYEAPQLCPDCRSACAKCPPFCRSSLGRDSPARSDLTFDGQAQQRRGIFPQDPGLLLLAQPAMEADRIGLGHVERVVGAQAQLVGPVGPDQAVELVLIEHQRVEPQLAQVARRRVLAVLAAVSPRAPAVIHPPPVAGQIASAM